MSGEREQAVFTADRVDMRLDALVSINCEITRAAAAKLITDSHVTVNAKPCTKKSARAKPGDLVRVILPCPVPCGAIPQDIPLRVIFEDKDLLVINKPQGMVVHPAPGNPDGTLVNALLFHCHGALSAINGVIRPGIVHRIDKDTSGLLVAAKNDVSHRLLAEQIKARTMKRIYYALLTGRPKKECGTVDAPIGRHPVHRKKMAVTEKGAKEAITHYRMLEYFNGYTLAEMTLETGRTHQIRVHAAYLGHPVAGDPLYAPGAGKNPFSLRGQCLHAKKLGFLHPSGGGYMEFDTDLPPYFEKALSILKRKDCYDLPIISKESEKKDIDMIDRKDPK